MLRKSLAIVEGGLGATQSPQKPTAFEMLKRCILTLSEWQFCPMKLMEMKIKSTQIFIYFLHQYCLGFEVKDAIHTIDQQNKIQYILGIIHVKKELHEHIS